MRTKMQWKNTEDIKADKEAFLYLIVAKILYIDGLYRDKSFVHFPSTKGFN